MSVVLNLSFVAYGFSNRHTCTVRITGYCGQTFTLTENERAPETL